MKSGIKSKKTIFRKNLFPKIYFAAGSFILLIALILYTNFLLRALREDVKVVPDLYSKFISLPADVNLETFLFQYFMTQIVPRIDYPIILADSLKKPYSWENIDIPKKDFDELATGDRKYLMKKVTKYESQGAVIPLKSDLESDKILSFVYYGETRSMFLLRIMPYLEMVLVVLFVMLGIYIVFSLRKYEENKIWVGLAKETAHQFGSPLSSLLGWRDLLEMKIDQKCRDEEMMKVLDYMKSDMERLNKIASRFGKVGSTIKLLPTNLHSIIQEVVDHFQKRLPTFSNKIDISFVSKIEGKKIKLDPDLIKWTLENLIKNSMDAMQSNDGKIEISAFSYKNRVYIQIRDQGKGIPKSMYKKVFLPGVTTKKRGWGLGLSLARRIIREYHRGTIHVLDSEINRGTTIEIIIPEV